MALAALKLLMRQHFGGALDSTGLMKPESHAEDPVLVKTGNLNELPTTSSLWLLN